MAYRLRPSEPFTHEFRKVATRQLTRAIGYLEDQPNGPHEAIHDARKRFKRLRALYRLAKPDAPDFRARENARIRDIARPLSAVRDATALVETIDYLSEFAASPEETEALEKARAIFIARRDHVAEEEHDLPERIRAAVTECQVAIAALDDLSLPDGSGKSARRLAKVWKKELAKARAALQNCGEHASAESYHDLRKSGQTYWMHLSLLRDAWPSAMSAKQAECKALVDILGHEHDLSVLTEILDAEPALFDDGDLLARLLAAIIARQQPLRQDALTRAAIVFADPPKLESDRIAHLWRHASTRGEKTEGSRKRQRDDGKETALHGAR